MQTNDASKKLVLPIKPSGFGSAVNGGELLLLAVEVECTGDFGAEGEAGSNFFYQVNVISDATAETVEELIRATDEVAEVPNTLRKGIDVKLIRK